MDQSVRQVTELLAASRLYSFSTADKLAQAWMMQAGDRSDRADLFLRWLCEQGHITDYQSTQLSRGHAEGYFLADYKILERIGRGKMAGVYRAATPAGETVAIKVLPPSRAKEADLLARFQREAELALQLQHPNAVRALQMGESGGLHFLVMEHLEGETLEDVLARRKRLPPLETIRMVIPLLDGLQHIHELGMVHRDVKPANLMLVPLRKLSEPDTTDRKTIKILDIGLGRTAMLEKDENDSQLTASGAILGTPDYMAPEQARDAKSVDIRADIYSVGCIMYHCLTSEKPFPDTNLISQMVRHATEPVRPLESFGIEVPPGLWPVLQKLLGKKPEHRHATPAEAAQALQAVLDATTAPPDRTAAMPVKFVARLDAIETNDDAAGAIHESDVDLADSTAITIPATQKKPAERPAIIEPTNNRRPARKPPVTAPRTREMPLSEVSTVAKAREPFSFTRRDLLMMAVGAAGTLTAVGLGYGLSRMLRVDPPQVNGSPDSTPANQVPEDNKDP